MVAGAVDMVGIPVGPFSREDVGLDNLWNATDKFLIIVCKDYNQVIMRLEGKCR